MEFETIDDSQNKFPAEAIEELKAMSKWMNITAVFLIIFGILAILGNLATISQKGTGFLELITNGVGVYLGFLVIKKAGFFNAFSETHNERELIEALKATKLYWMISVILIIVGFFGGMILN